MDDQAKVIAILEGGLYNEATLLQLMHWVDETTRTFGLSKSATQEEKKELKTVARNIIGKYTIQGILDRAFGEAPGKTHFKTILTLALHLFEFQKLLLNRSFFWKSLVRVLSTEFRK